MKTSSSSPFQVDEADSGIKYWGIASSSQRGLRQNRSQNNLCSRFTQYFYSLSLLLACGEVPANTRTRRKSRNRCVLYFKYTLLATLRIWEIEFKTYESSKFCWWNDHQWQACLVSTQIIEWTLQENHIHAYILCYILELLFIRAARYYSLLHVTVKSRTAPGGAFKSYYIN